MVLPVSSQKQKKTLPSAVDKCRYVRTNNLLPGVARISDKREKGCFASSGKKGQLLVWFIKGSTNIRYAYCMEIGVMRTVLLFYCCCRLYSGPVVIMF